MPEGFPRSIFYYWEEGGISVINAALPIMRAYKRKGIALDAKWDPAKFDKDNPWFVRLWGEVLPGSGSDAMEAAVTLSGEAMVEVLAFVGPSFEGYPLLMTKAKFDSEYEID